MSSGCRTCLWVCLWLGLGQNDGATPLYVASENGHVDVVKALVKAGAALNQAEVCDRMPSCVSSVVCTRMSLGRRTGADIFVSSGESRACACIHGLGQNDGRTPLFIASREGHVPVVEALVTAGAALNQAKV